MSLIVIDEHGKIWDASSVQLRRAFGSVQANVQFSEYVVVKLGYIAINHYQNSCQIRIKPALVSSCTLKSLAAHLEKRQTERYALSFLDKTWHFELYSSRQTLIQKLIKLMIDLRAPSATDRRVYV